MASWSLGLGLSALLLAVLLVVLAAVTTVAPGRMPAVALDWGAIALAGAAILAGARFLVSLVHLRAAIQQHQRSALLLRMSAGLVAAVGALAATLISGNGT
jgi:hypothetical protein